MMDKKLNELKKQYQNARVPDELDDIVEAAIMKGKKEKMKNHKKMPTVVTKWVGSVAAAAAIFTVGLNTSPALAQTVNDIPVIGKVTQVLTFREYKENDKNYGADIKVANVKGLDNKKLEQTLNERYIADGQKLYSHYEKTVKDLEKKGGGHYSVDSGYKVLLNDQQLLTIERYEEQTAASSSTTMKYDTIDKEKKIVLSLPMLFKDKAYVDHISSYIKDKMIKEIKESNQEKVYWVRGAGVPVDDLAEDELFESIKTNQNFYINKKHQLVIAFDEYEVAPGYMGVVKFTIPTHVIEKDLVSNKYIK